MLVRLLPHITCTSGYFCPPLVPRASGPFVDKQVAFAGQNAGLFFFFARTSLSSGEARSSLKGVKIGWEAEDDGGEIPEAS